MFSLIEIASRKYKQISLGIFCCLSYYRQQIYKSWMYHWFLSRLKGVSIATKEHQSLHLRYIYEGQEYEVWLPFERRLVSKMLNQTFIVYNTENNDTRRIQQQPGIPYMVTPGNLGASGGYITTIHREKEIAKDQKVDLY